MDFPIWAARLQQRLCDLKMGKSSRAISFVAKYQLGLVNVFRKVDAGTLPHRNFVLQINRTRNIQATYVET